MQGKFPGIGVLEVMMASGGAAVSGSACQSWVTDNSLTHPVVRDNGSIAQGLLLKTYDVVIADRYLKIVFRGSLASQQSQILSALGAL